MLPGGGVSGDALEFGASSADGAAFSLGLKKTAESDSAIRKLGDLFKHGVVSFCSEQAHC